MDTSFHGSNITLVKSHNLQVVLKSLLHKGKLSRVELANQTSLSSTTITNLVNELLMKGIVREVDSSGEDQPRSVGRPRRTLELNPDAGHVIGVHIGIGTFRIAVTNLFAEPMVDVICSNLSRAQIIL